MGLEGDREGRLDAGKLNWKPSQSTRAFSTVKRLTPLSPYKRLCLFTPCLVRHHMPTRLEPVLCSKRSHRKEKPAHRNEE